MAKFAVLKIGGGFLGLGDSFEGAIDCADQEMAPIVLPETFPMWEPSLGEGELCVIEVSDKIANFINNRDPEADTDYLIDRSKVARMPDEIFDIPRLEPTNTLHNLISPDEICLNLIRVGGDDPQHRDVNPTWHINLKRRMCATGLALSDFRLETTVHYVWTSPGAFDAYAAPDGTFYVPQEEICPWCKASVDSALKTTAASVVSILKSRS